MRIIILMIIMLLICYSCLAMTEAEFAVVKIGDKVLLDFTRWGMPIMEGKVIDRGKDWARVYEARKDGSWVCQQWHCYYITKVIEKAPSDLAELQTQLKQKDDLIAKLRAIISQLISSYNAMTFY